LGATGRRSALAGRGQGLVNGIRQALDLEGQDDAHDADRHGPDARDGDERRQRLAIRSARMLPRRIRQGKRAELRLSLSQAA
jgi:hypothetical protein